LLAHISSSAGGRPNETRNKPRREAYVRAFLLEINRSPK
jgi:hypothetical protein